MIGIIVITAGLANPVSIETADAQDRTEIIASTKKVRKVKRKTKRRVRRRVSRRAHFAYRGLPRYRSLVNVVPPASVFIRKSGVSYHYHEGVFYRPMKSEFIIVRPASGLRVAVLPSAMQRLRIQNKSYVYYYGTYYIENQGGYIVVDAPIGAVVHALPSGYGVKEVHGTEFYVLDNVYYQEVEDDDRQEGYQVVIV